MNIAFNKVFVREDTTLDIPAPSQVFQGNKLQDIGITRNEVKKKLSELNDGKVPGPDGVSPYVLKQCADILCTPLLEIYSTSLRTGDVPPDWRKANISPIHKKWSRTNPLNYRPVSLTSTVSKVMESIIREHIVQHLTDNTLITDAQHGFRKKKELPNQYVVLPGRPDKCCGLRVLCGCELPGL